MSTDAVHDQGTKFYVLYLENVHLATANDAGNLQCCIHWYIGDHDYSSVPFTFNKGVVSHELKNCGFLVVPDSVRIPDFNFVFWCFFDFMYSVPIMY